MPRRLVIAAVIGLTLVCVGGSRSGATLGGALKPTTLVSLSSTITAFAQDGDRVAWSSFASECEEPVVHVLSLSTRARTALPSKPGPKTCDIGDVYPAPTLALAGERALWPLYNQSHQETDGYFVTAAVNDRVERRVCGFGVVGGSEDSYTPTLATAGDGQTLVFTMAGDPGSFGHVCSGLWRVDPHGHASQITATASMLFAVGGARIAVAQTTDYGGCVCTSSPAWSPDGTRIAFASRASGSAEIYVVNADGTGERRIGLGDSPDWSPDGTKIVFARQRDEQGAADLVITNADGTGERVFGAGSAPRWLPDGSRIAFNKLDADGLDEIHVMNADGSGERNLGRGAGQAWSPDGSRLAFVRYDGIYVSNGDGTGLRKVGSQGGARSLAWSPDGTRIAYHVGLEIDVVNADASGEARLTNPAGFEDSTPVWSPDGRRIAFLRGTNNPDNDALENTRVWVMNGDGSGQTRLMQVNKDEHDPQWSPDGGRIAFARGELYLVSADGSGQIQLTTTQPTEARSSAELRSARSGRLIATAAAAGRVQAIALSRSTAALLVEGFFGRRIELFDARSTASLGTFSVPASTAPELSAAGANVVFRVGNTIYVLDGQRRTVRILAVAKATPIGLSIEGRRVAWAENLRKRARIRAVVLPAQ